MHPPQKKQTNKKQKQKQQKKQDVFKNMLPCHFLLIVIAYKLIIVL